jgi:hypothetical protein
MKKVLLTIGTASILVTSLVFIFKDDNHSAKQAQATLSTNVKTPIVTGVEDKTLDAKKQADKNFAEQGVLTTAQLELSDSVEVTIGVKDITDLPPIDDEAFLNEVEAFDKLDESLEDNIASSSDIDLEHRPAGWEIVGAYYYDPLQTGIATALPKLQSPEHDIVAKVDDFNRKEQSELRQAAFEERLENHPERQALHELRQRLNDK